MPTTSLPTLAVARLTPFLGTPPEHWRGRCAWVAEGLRLSGLLRGRWEHQYGLWHGPIAPSSRPFGGRAVTHHAWLKRADDGLLCDPTRWVFEDVKPYVWFGRDDARECYDFGGNRLRRATMGGCPVFDATVARYTLLLDQESADWVSFHARVEEVQGTPGLTVSLNQLFWIANAPPDLLGSRARAVYEELVRLKLAALIPIDNRRAVLS